MRRRLLILAALAAAASPAASTSISAADAQSRPAARPADQRTETIARLHKRVTVELTDQRLEDVVRFAEDLAGVDIEIKWLDGSHHTGLDPDALVSLTSRNQTLLSLLERAAQRAGDPFDPTTWQMTPDGVLEIGPRSRLNETRYLRTYDVQDLLFVVPSFREVPDLDLGAIQQGGGGGGQSVQLTPEEGERMTRPERLARLVEIIISNIEPEQWRDNGGDAATLSEFNGALLVNAPEYIHRQLMGAPYWPTDAQIRAVNRDN